MHIWVSYLKAVSWKHSLTQDFLHSNSQFYLQSNPRFLFLVSAKLHSDSLVQSKKFLFSAKKNQQLATVATRQSVKWQTIVLVSQSTEKCSVLHSTQYLVLLAVIFRIGISRTSSNVVQLSGLESTWLIILFHHVKYILQSHSNYSIISISKQGITTLC